ncbi:cyclic-phosphate processing receiver domain-containing protein [Paenibacillus sp. 8b26]|uniref:cyclic-phosphate processing receiver domain-containing protein n=1 Tax=Paenibacillus sp. 8b26 TaxID=3424133 RepID=UPI003D651C13
MTNKINLYVDDLRDCPEGFVVARTYYEAIDILESNSVAILTLDHDLGEDVNGVELTGMTW